MTIRREKGRFLADVLLLFSVQRHLGLMMVPVHTRLDQGPQALGVCRFDARVQFAQHRGHFDLGQIAFLGPKDLRMGRRPQAFVINQQLLVELLAWAKLFHDLSIRIVTDDASPLTQDFLHSDNFLF